MTDSWQDQARDAAAESAYPYPTKGTWPNRRRLRVVVNRTRTPADRAFMAEGACVGHHPDRWFPDKLRDEHHAKTICNTCPVRTECLDYAIAEGIEYGIWGGLNPWERGHERRR